MIKIKGLSGELFFEKLLERNIRIEKNTQKAILITISLLNNKDDIMHLVEEIQKLND